MAASLWGQTCRASLWDPALRAQSTAAASNMLPIPSPRRSGSTIMPKAATPYELSSIPSRPTTAPSSSATNRAAPSRRRSHSNPARRLIRSTGASRAIQRPSMATASSRPRAASRSSSRAGRTETTSGEQKGAAVDHEGLAREVAAGVGAEEEDHRCDVVLRVTLATDGVVAKELSIGLVVAGRRLLAPLGGGTRADAVDDDPVPPPLAGRRSRQGPDRLLGRVVGAVAAHAGDAGGRSD